MNRKQVSDRPITWRPAAIAVLLGCWMLNCVSMAQETPSGDVGRTRRRSATSGDRSEVAVIRLTNSQAPAIAKVLADVFKDVSISIGIDNRSNSLVIKAFPSTLESVGSVVSQLDRADSKQVRSNSTPPTEFRVRLVWLVSGLSHEDAPEPSGYLKEVVDALAAQGVRDLRQVGQSVVRTAPNYFFHVNSSPALASRSTTLQVSGIVRVRPKMSSGPKLEIKILADGPGADKSRSQLVNLDTAISANYGHYVVLGIAPIDKITSVFVVQLTPNPLTQGL